MRINNININTNFGTNERFYLNKHGNCIGCATCLYRNDLNWDIFARYVIQHFKKTSKVNVENFAASDGSETYTFIMALIENIGRYQMNNPNKFFPIKAYDIDLEIIKVAKSGLMKVSNNDIRNLIEHTNNYKDYFVRTPRHISIPNDNYDSANINLQAQARLTDNVNFAFADMFKKIKTLRDNSNTILICRNILGYFDRNTVEYFIFLASEALKSGSLFLIGNYDNKKIDMHNVMNKFDFKMVMKNVYQKM